MSAHIKFDARAHSCKIVKDLFRRQINSETANKLRV